MVEMGTRLRAVGVIEKYGNCLELVSMDPNFENISVGLYMKDGVCTIWTFSSKAGVSARIEQIRDQLVTLGGVEAVEGTTNQVRFACGELHERAIKFLMSQAVGKAPDFAPPQGEMAIKDSRSPLTIKVSGAAQDDAVCIFGVGRGGCAESGGAAADGGGGVPAIWRDGKGGGRGGGFPLWGAA